MNTLNSLNYMDTYNAVIGAVIAFLTFVFGKHWILFTLFLFFNIIDYITGWMKSRLNKKESSVKGWQGVLKKLGYWIMIMIAFSASVLFIEIGNTLGIDLGITTLLGWFVLASLAINELRSIVENLVEAGYNIPNVLTKGLEVADKLVNKEETK
ncbi:phage holin family protein [Thomasclavelia cocleata]|uniref:phage holin family protein n=1 Tax=Thomasclavelia cocleata TaxID=69824 RepID=UPI002430C71A|nr:phage holin family protein [Thomasclavelia cocleata]